MLSLIQQLSNTIVPIFQFNYIGGGELKIESIVLI